MSEQEHIQLIDEAFAGFSAGVAPSVPSVDPAAVHKTVVRRRRMHTTAFSVLAALAIAVPIAAYAASTRGGQGPPNPAGSDGPVALPTAAATTEPPDGRLTDQQLAVGGRDIPAWGAAWPLCPSGTVVLNPKEGLAQLRDRISLLVTDVAHTNLDGDDALETAAIIECGNPTRGGTETSQIVAFDRRADGEIVTLGSILVTEQDRYIVEMVTRPRGGITVQVGQEPGDEKQVQEFAWDGQKISQVSPGSLSHGLLKVEDFSAGQVPVPSWGAGLEHCPSGDVRLNAGPTIGTRDLTHVNIDDDDDFETAVTIKCTGSDGSSVSQLVVYERTAGGKIVLMGQVTAEGANRSLGILHEATTSPGGRTLLVGISPPGADQSTMRFHEFRWDGSRFTQVGG